MSKNRRLNRRTFLAGIAETTALVAVHGGSTASAQATADTPLNLAKVAIPSSMTVASENKITWLNDGGIPANSHDRRAGTYTFRAVQESELDGEQSHAQWVQYDWSAPVAIDKVDIYWAIDPPRPNAGYPGTGARRFGLAAPVGYRILYWNGSGFAPVANPKGLTASPDNFNTTSFDEIKTTKLRLEVTPASPHPAGVMEWKVYNSGPAPTLAPTVDAGVDRSVVIGGETYLSGKTIWLEDKTGNSARWTKQSGPGAVTFANASAPVTTASFSVPGDYVLKLAGVGNNQQATSTVNVHAEGAPPKNRLDVVYTTKYSVNSLLWSARAKALIVDWIPHCIRYCERTDIAPNRGDGGLDNFVEAGKANRGEPHGPHKGYVFSNAWIHQTIESMCIALMVDGQGDRDIIEAQTKMKATLEKWIPIILSAQMPDGYLQTAYTLADRKSWPDRWSPEHRSNHEGYVSGYFIESAINHYTLTGGKDLRLYNAAKKLSDCWVANLGPGKKEWFDGHQQMEQALVRFGRFVNDQEGNGRGDDYIRLAKFLLDSRRGGQEYDQSHLPPGQQYEAVGHAVRAVYFYSGMADIAAETQDRDYQSAVISLWDNMVNKKYYLTGGIGSGETSEGFGPNYSLRNNSYCESCSSCGLIFFQYKLNLAYHDAKYVDLYEQTMYNALLGSVDLEGKSFCYTNPLVNTQRARWHVCPCCVGNIARTLLMMPTWSYVKGNDGIYVNMFVGSRMNVGKVAGTDLEMVQTTDYPWKGAVAITINPKQSKTFTVYVRIPKRATSKLYIDSPAIDGVKRFTVNGQPVKPWVERGYAAITRKWKAGDRIELELPIEPQRVIADNRIKADLGTVALKYGPLVYNVENADSQNIRQQLSDAPLKAEWRPDLLGGVMVITGTWKDGSPMIAVPNYARMNRTGSPVEYPEENHVRPPVESKVWI